ncbi:MAG: heavy metal translocating P-type ATPase metal-binding domain-containing protein [Saprospiraceae bacterium]|nr:heavy metal translocating P-type ATPase metal-binding domain-containing protein [Saprospiraceae bacterium]
MKNTTALRPVPAADTETRCFHCHDVCADVHLRRDDDKIFCCEGCVLVYDILNSNDLCQYYTLAENPGRSLQQRRDARAYAWLDDEETKSRLIRYSDGHTARVDFLLPAMHCASCIWLLEHLYRLDKGVQRSRVNFLKKTVTIHFDEQQTSLRQLAALLSSIGYPPEINLGDVDGKPGAVIDRSLLYRIGLAGFAFGNIMLLSFPEYLGLEAEQYRNFFHLFGYLNLFLSTPVLLYSARDYFVSAWNGLRHRHLNIDVPLALGMLVLYGRSAFEVVSGAGAGYFDSFAGLVFFLLIGKWFQQKTWHHLSFERDYRSYFPVAATVRRANAEEVATPVQKLNPGDILLIRHGELIPADGILLKGRAEIDYSFVTGEADPVAVPTGERVFAGGKQTGEAIEISLTRKVSTSYLTQLWNDAAFQTKEKSHATELADRAGRYFTAVILGVAGLSFVYWAAVGQIAVAVNAFTAVLIIACPCAVALSIPFTLGNTLRLLGRRQFYVKNTPVLEAFERCDAVVFDKTGTISSGEKSVAQEFQPAGHQENLRSQERVAVKSLVRQSNHPLSRQVFESLSGVMTDTVESYREIPGKGIRGTVGGLRVRLGSAEYLGYEADDPSGVWVEIEGTVRGRFAMQHTYRDGLKELLSYFNENGAKTWLLSGDNDREAAALKPLFPLEGQLQFNKKPQDKLDFVRHLQQQGHKVLMFGDGLNDAGALQQSNVGVVIAENTNNFTPACDAILQASRFEEIPRFLDQARFGVQTVNRAYLLAAVYNVVGLSYAVSGTLSPVVAAILMPLSSVTIVAFGVGMTSWKGWNSFRTRES